MLFTRDFDVLFFCFFWCGLNSVVLSRSCLFVWWRIHFFTTAQAQHGFEHFSLGVSALLSKTLNNDEYSVYVKQNKLMVLETVIVCEDVYGNKHSGTDIAV